MDFFLSFFISFFVSIISKEGVVRPEKFTNQRNVYKFASSDFMLSSVIVNDCNAEM